jgi:hypothetical protein
VLKRRTSDSIWVISMRDPALLSLSPQEIETYLLTRDASKVDAAIAAKGEVATRFLVRPLQTRYERLLSYPDADALWNVFALHVERIDGGDFAVEWTESNGVKRLSDSVREQIPHEVVVEVATVIAQAASRSDITPFTLPDGWRDFLTRSRIARAMTASIEPAKA